MTLQVFEGGVWVPLKTVAVNNDRDSSFEVDDIDAHESVPDQSQLQAIDADGPRFVHL